MVSPIYKPMMEVLCLSVINYNYFCCLLDHAVLRPQLGGRFVEPWALLSSTQLFLHGLWCQVNSANNPSNIDIGDMFYPTGNGPNGFSVASTATDSVPFRQLKCTDQIGLVVISNIVNYQGVVKCTTTIPNLDTDTNYWVVYLGSEFISYCKLPHDIFNLS